MNYQTLHEATFPVRRLGAGLPVFAISCVLYGLFFFNPFQDRGERIGEHLRIIILHAGIGSSPSEIDHSKPA